MDMIRLEEIHKSFGHNHVLRGVSLSVQPGEVVCIIGPSGSGKSTLLRCINYLEVPERGRIFIDGEPAYRDEVNGHLKQHPMKRIVAVREKVGMVSAVGVGIANDHVHTRRALQALESMGVPVLGVHASALRLSFLVPSERVDEAVKRLHEVLVAG